LANDFNFSSNINTQLENVDARELLQTSVFCFVTSVIKTQPGLASLFLKGCDPSNAGNSILLHSGDESSASSNIPSDSILSAVVMVLDKWQQFVKLRSSVLPAVMDLLETLWKSASEHQSSIRLLTQQPNFWKNVLDIILSKSPLANDDVVNSGGDTMLVDRKGAVDSESSTKSYCFWINAREHAVKIVGYDIFYHKIPEHGDKTCLADFQFSKTFSTLFTSLFQHDNIKKGIYGKYFFSKTNSDFLLL
jgi:hypothetical protein